MKGICRHCHRIKDLVGLYCVGCRADITPTRRPVDPAAVAAEKIILSRAPTPAPAPTAPASLPEAKAPVPPPAATPASSTESGAMFFLPELGDGEQPAGLG